MKKFKETILKELRKDPDLVKEYFFDALQENDPEYFMSVLKDIAEALNIQKIADTANISRMTIYRILSGENNPRLDTFFSVLRAILLQMNKKKAA